MTSKTFQRTQEDFTCDHCGFAVTGNGYTNHCPKCLWSKHVDVYPGDRAADCRGMMVPVGLEIKGGAYTIVHRCERCGHERRNRTGPDDDMDAVIRLSATAQD